MHSMQHLENLNNEQKKAVFATEGPVLIVAGAGAGKTKTITHRILHLIINGVPPEKILAITFTNKAAKEMRERVMDLIAQLENSSASVRVESVWSPRQANRPFVSTFHSLGVQIIKENAELLKLPRHFNIFDKSDSKKVVKDIITSFGLDPKEHLDKIQHIISREKGGGVDIKEYMERESFDYTSDITKKVWTKYEEVLKRESALDFDDLLLKTLKLLKTYPDILEKYQNRFLYIHVDEYQDTNKVQSDITDLIAKKYQNICIVGDTDQCIYGWRQADIKNMIHFEKRYPNAQTFFLEQNYRSTKNILAVANEIIEKNNFRIPKKLFTNNIDGEKIAIFKARSEVDEAHFIALKSKWLISNGVKDENIAVLYRANFQSRILEEAFLSYGVPYQMLGTKFFERKEIKDCLAYIKASLNPDDLSDFIRVINIPPRGIGKTTVQKILQGQENELPESTKIKINSFRNMLSEFEKILITKKPSEAIKYIIKTSGIEDSLNTGKEEDLERLENVMELVSLATEYDTPTENDSEKNDGESQIEKFLTNTALTSDQDSLDNTKRGVKLMTVHSSKGLEFDYVFVSGLEEDLFPHKKFDTKKSGEDSEEERRLFYVAVTRAGKKLFLTHAETRNIFGKTEINSPSEFILDISEKYTEKESFGETYKEPLISIDF